MFLTLIFAFISVMLVIKLNEMLGTFIGFQRTDQQNEKPDQEDNDGDHLQATNAHYREKSPELDSVKRCFPDFYEHKFIGTVSEVFKCIFKAYADGDTELLKELLTPKMYNAFQMAISDRASRGETLTGNVERIISVDIDKVSIDDTKVLIDVKFVTEQTNILKNATGEIIEGSNDFINTVQEVWTFCRSLDSKKKQWYLSEITYISEQ